INDLKTAEALGDSMAPLKVEGIEWRLGEPVEGCLDGMDMMVISPGIPVEHPAVALARSKGIEVIGEVELAYRLGRGHVVAVTGTNGKTTTTTLLGEVFKNAGRISYVVGNIGDPYSAYASQMKDDDMVVCELSSFQLETVDTFRPEISLILNLTEDHLNRHHTMENYAAVKERVFMNQRGDDCVVLNYDDPITRGMAAHVKCRVVWFSRTQVPPEGAFVKDGLIVFGGSDAPTPVCKVEDVYIPGPHNLENALAATAAAICAGVPAPVVRHTLRTFHGVEHRIETVRVLDGVKYINDSKGTNPDSTVKAVETMKEPTVIILGGSEKNSDFGKMCEVIRRNPITYAVLIGKTGERIGEALKAHGFTAFEYAGYDFEQAIRIARAHAVTGGNVLLSPACASFDMFSDYEARGREFKRIVNELKEA
ncbi:MAG: UDP-N-acetylmuramoyl-L-alanine--D-glutamate ligase, partial [Clostridia bacterium]|nr:UDP-N-acetylmuramoyl-L-alanine--D-glutamate ligase [Clostridia bacterium]